MTSLKSVLALLLACAEENSDAQKEAQVRAHAVTCTDARQNQRRGSRTPRLREGPFST